MKKIFTLATLLLAGTLSFTSCGGSDDPAIVIDPAAAYNLNYSDANAKAWGNYMRAVAQRLVNDAKGLYNDWNTSYNGGKSYADIFRAHDGSGAYNSALDCINEILDGCSEIANEVGDAKIGDPYKLFMAGKKVEALYAVESWFSWHSREDYANNILSIRNAYFGSRNGIVNGNSISALVAGKDASVDAKMKEYIEAARVAILSIPQPFRNHIDSKEAADAASACADLRDYIDDTLKPFINNSANGLKDDAVLQPTVDQYVSSVILPTYSDLQTRVEALLKAVNAFAASPSDAGFQACADAWLSAREPWEQSEAFLFGPVDTKGYDPNMDTWPLDVADIIAILNSGKYAMLDWSGEYDEENESIEKAQKRRGFHTLEYFIFKDGQPRTVSSKLD